MKARAMRRLHRDETIGDPDEVRAPNSAVLQGDGTPDTFEAIRDGGEWPISLEFLAPRVAAVLQHEDVNAIPRSASSPNSATAPGNGKP